MSELTKVTVIEVRDRGEWGTFFVRESPVVPREGRGFQASAEWTANTSFGVYGHYWSSMGCSFGEFIADISEDYLLGKIGRQVTDSDKVTKEVKRLVTEARKEKRITAHIAREAMEEIKQLASYYDGEILCHQLYESLPLSKCQIEWCDISTKEYCGQSLGFARKLWPLFVKQYNEQSQQAVA